VKRPALIAAVVLAALLLLAAGGAAWILTSESGTRWLVARAQAAMPDRLAVGAVRGALTRGVTLQDVSWRSPENGPVVRIGRLQAVASLGALLARTVHVRSLVVDDVAVALGAPRPEEESEPFSLRPPIDVRLDEARASRVRVTRAGGTLLEITFAAASGAWTAADGVVLDRLAIDSPQGTVRLAARVREHGTLATAPAPRPAAADRAGGAIAARGSTIAARNGAIAAREAPRPRYVGRADGTFRWTVGARTFAGQLVASTPDSGADASLVLDVSEPAAARIEASLVQRTDLPWQADVTLPRTAGSKLFGPDPPVRDAALQLAARGDARHARVQGVLEVNRQRISLEPLALAWSADELRIDELVARPEPTGGTITGKGRVLLAGDSPRADIALRWESLVLPRAWTGQALATHGTATFQGGSDDFRARTAFAAGPRGRLADVVMDVHGSTRVLDLDALTITERTARLHAAGRLELAPIVRWRLDADAQRFDPAVFLADWPGRLQFSVRSAGELRDGWPAGTLQLDSLDGTLRGRRLSGRGNVETHAERLLAGNLELRSGASAVRIAGRGRDRVDVEARLDVPSLDDWIPGARGEVRGRFRATGTMAALAIAGSARARNVAWADAHVPELALDIDVTNPRRPSGTVRVTGRGLRYAGFGADTLLARLEGRDTAHSLQLTVRGDPLSLDTRITGRLDGNRWSGTLQRLDLTATDVGRFALQRPAALAFAPGTFRVDETCLADHDVRLCAAAAGDPSGAMTARYALDAVPLGWAKVLAPQLPVTLSGVVSGRGDVRRAADGALFGNATIVSPDGRVRRGGTAGTGDELLLRYANLHLDATLQGDAARVTMRSGLFNGGSLEAALAASALRSPAPALQGRADLALPSLRPLEMFATQLASVTGHATLHADVSGTTAAPRIAASLRVEDFGAEVPRVGIAVNGGRVDVTVRPEGTLALSGELTSGKGRITLEGGTAPGTTLFGTGGSPAVAGGPGPRLAVNVRGTDFLAADLPGVRVIASPDLVATYDGRGAALRGTVVIPEASVNIARLPGSGPRKVSPDVVVVDAEAQPRADEFPLRAIVTAKLGDAVAVSGYGLEAKVGGQVEIREAPGEPTTGSGQLAVSGTYKAYGQDLTIERGRLLFAGTPIDDPRLDILAVRKIEAENVTAQLTVTGTARSPALAISADPPMPQSQAISWLVTGRPLDRLGSGEGDLVQSAARSLGGAAGNLVAKGIGRRLGIDTFGIEQDPTLGSSVFTIGQYLSPRLYLSYGVGLFEPGQIVTLRLRVSNSVSVEASQTQTATRAGIEYRVER